MTMENTRSRLLILICVTVALVAVLVWRLTAPSAPSDGDGVAFRRIQDLANNGDDAALVKEASNKDSKAACRAVRVMGRVGTRALPGIRAAMKDTRPEVRQEAMIAVSSAGNEGDTPVLSNVVAADESAVVRAAAARTLGRMKAYTEVELLLKAMDDDDLNVRRHANAAIVKIIGASVSFKASDPVEKRRADIASMRAMWGTMKAKTIEFYENRKRYRETHGNK